MAKHLKVFGGGAHTLKGVPHCGVKASAAASWAFSKNFEYNLKDA